MSLASLSACESYGYYRVDGQTRLLGSSFGVLGINSTFDYVVVGGGTSGLTVAARLAEDPDVSVAVIEGGGFYETDNGNISQIPAFDVEYSSPSPSSIQPLVDWGIVTIPQQQLAGRQIHYTQGKCLGGSSARNYLAYHRGTVGAFQQWADKVGDQSYTFEALLPYFRKSPQLTPPNYGKRQAGGPVLYDPNAFSTAGGPLQVSYANYWQPISGYFKNAFASLGLTPLPGFNSGKLLGYSEFTVTVDPEAETRSSSETSFLQSAILSAPSAQIYQRTLAKKIIFNKNKTAIGVAVSTDGVSYTLSAKKEVVLAAGVFRSPQLLMVSGVGPAATLQELKIPVISDLPGVGQNMWDQPYFGTAYRVNVTTQSQLSVNPLFAAQATEQYLRNQTGPLTNPAGNSVGFEKLPQSLRSQLSSGALHDLAEFPTDWPELELLPLASATVATNDSDNYASVTIAVLATTSRGNVTINSTDTSLNPLISPNWLLTQTDQEVAVQGLKRARQIAAASGITATPEFAPGPTVETDAQILDYIQQSLAPIHHASATCAMGKAGDADAVVDSKGKVFGVNGLRLVDISVFPFLPPGHTQATVYMLAEKLADDIRNGR
ncbi:glucose-methanol-choline oxidoreductase [Usnea florida]